MIYLEYSFNNNIVSSKQTLENMFFNMAKKYYNKNNLTIIKNVNGKPYFKNYDKLHFNGTHSKDLFVCVMSDNFNVGIDAEKIKKRNYLSIAKEYFFESEYRYLTNSLKLDIDFFTIWTIKEAYIKMLGKTIFDIKNSIKIDLIERDIKNADNLFFSSFMIDYSYIISFCADINKVSNIKENKEIDLNLQDFNLNLIFSYPYLPNIKL